MHTATRLWCPRLAFEQVSLVVYPFFPPRIRAPTDIYSRQRDQRSFTLIELCGQYILRHGVDWHSNPDLPDRLVRPSTPLLMNLSHTHTSHPQRRMLADAHACAFCGSPILECFREVLKMDIVCTYHRVPLLFRICNRPHSISDML